MRDPTFPSNATALDAREPVAVMSALPAVVVDARGAGDNSGVCRSLSRTAPLPIAASPTLVKRKSGLAPRNHADTAIVRRHTVQLCLRSSSLRRTSSFGCWTPQLWNEGSRHYNDEQSLMIKWSSSVNESTSGT